MSMSTSFSSFCWLSLHCPHTHTIHTILTHAENLQLGLGMQSGTSSPPRSTHTHIQKKTPPVPLSMPEQAAPAPDTAVVFSADNLLPRMPALSFCKNFSHLWALSVREPPHADYRIKWGHDLRAFAFLLRKALYEVDFADGVPVSRDLYFVKYFKNLI